MKVEYRAWMDEMSASLAWSETSAGADAEVNRLRRQRAVQAALSQLIPLSRRVIIQHYFEGEPLSAIAVALDLDASLVVTELRQGLRVLRSLLAGFVAEEFRMKITKDPCVICSSAEVAAIEALLRSRTEGENYVRVIAEVYRRHGVRLKSPRTIIGHLKYHCYQGAAI